MIEDAAILNASGTVDLKFVGLLGEESVSEDSQQSARSNVHETPIKNTREPSVGTSNIDESVMMLSWCGLSA